MHNKHKSNYQRLADIRFGDVCHADTGLIRALYRVMAQELKSRGKPIPKTEEVKKNEPRTNTGPS